MNVCGSRLVGVKMEVNKYEWWATPIWEIETDLSRGFNDNLLKELDFLPKNSYYNIWDYKTPCLNVLKDQIFQALDRTVQPYFPNYYPYDPCIINGWVNKSSDGKDMALHDHGGAILACVYYVKAPEGSGDLQLVDPRGGVNWEWIQDDGSYNVKYKKIKPKEGTLVIFPGYVMHSVMKNECKGERVSIATNIHNGKLTTINRDS